MVSRKGHMEISQSVCSQKDWVFVGCLRTSVDCMRPLGYSICLWWILPGFCSGWPKIVSFQILGKFHPRRGRLVILVCCLGKTQRNSLAGQKSRYFKTLEWCSTNPPTVWWNSRAKLCKRRCKAFCHQIKKHKCQSFRFPHSYAI